MIARAALVLALSAGSAASAQTYREPDVPNPLMRADQEEVLKPPPRPAPPGAVAASQFRAAYARAKRPRMMVFWNRTLSEEVASNYRTTGRAASAGVVVGGPGYVAGASASEVSIGRERDKELPRRTLTEVDDFAVESAFTSALSANGAVLVDRNVAMRTARGARGAGPEANIQEIETQAATGRAQLLIEVNQTPADTASGAAYRVTVKDLRTARILANVLSRGEPRLGRAPLVAGRGGFVRAAPPELTPDRVGRQVAEEVMAALSGAF